MNILDYLKLTKTEVDDGDATQRQVLDREALGNRMQTFGETAQALGQMPQIDNTPMMPRNQGAMAPQMPQLPPMSNPYAPVNYGTMSQQPQMGGIGSAPSMEQILRALQSQQR